MNPIRAAATATASALIVVTTAASAAPLSTAAAFVSLPPQISSPCISSPLPQMSPPFRFPSQFNIYMLQDTTKRRHTTQSGREMKENVRTESDGKKTYVTTQR